MSLCSHTARAFSRSRAPKSNTLLPFLYQTATIQQWKPATRPVARRNISSRPRRQDDTPLKEDIPFEDAEGTLPPTIEEAQSARKTTITDTERAAFEKLYKTFNTQRRSKEKDGEHEEADQIADEYYEDDEEGSGNSLDKVFEQVLRGSPRLQNAQKDCSNVQSILKKSSGASALIKEPSSLEADTPQNKKKIAARTEKERIRKLRHEDRDRIDKLIKSAQTDLQLWQILDREVFEQLRKLDLDNANTDKKEQRPTKTRVKLTPTANIDTRILFPNYPHHLLTAIQTLRFHFPRSPLPLTILPTIKALGRSSYALGATTQLYKHLLRTAWVQQSSYTMIDTLLTDMESNIVEFDLEILEVLDGVIREHEMAKSGKLGREMQMVFGMGTWLEGIGKIKVWRNGVAGRLGVQEEIVQERAVRTPERVVRRPERDMRTPERIVRRPEHGMRGSGRDGNMREADLPLVEGTNDVRAASDTISDAIPFVGEQKLDNTPPDTEVESGDRIENADTLLELPLEEEMVKDEDKPAKILL